MKSQLKSLYEMLLKSVILFMNCKYSIESCARFKVKSKAIVREFCCTHFYMGMSELTI